MLVRKFSLRDSINTTDVDFKIHTIRVDDNATKYFFLRL